MTKFNIIHAENLHVLILGLGSAGSRLIQKYENKYEDAAELRNIRMKGFDRCTYGLDATEIDRVSLKRRIKGISSVLLVNCGGGRAGGEMTSLAAVHALSKKMPVHVVLSYPLLWEGNRRARNAIALHEELKAKGATVSVVDGKKISDIEFEGYEQEFAVLDSLMLKEVGLWVAEAQRDGQ